jgi:hypothetical protein
MSAFFVTRGNGDAGPDARGASATAVEACNTLAFDNAAADATKYESDAFLPRNDVSGHNDVAPYVTGKDGLFTSPLGGKADEGSLAAVMAVITDRATDKSAAVDPNYSYTDHFNRDLADFNGTNGTEVGKQDCEKTYPLLSQIADFNGDWARKGEKVTQFVAVRNGQNQIVGFRLKAEIASGTMTGIEFAYSPSDKNVAAGFPSVLEDNAGRLFVKGFVPDESGKNGEGKPTPTPSPSENNQNNRNQNNSQGGTGNGQGSGGGVNVGKQGCGTGGENCGGGAGSGNGNQGPTGSGTGGSGGGGGNGGGGGGGTPTPTPTHESPTPTPTPTHETTPPPPPTSTVPSKSPAPSPSPTPCDDPFNPNCH